MIAIRSSGQIGKLLRQNELSQIYRLLQRVIFSLRADCSISTQPRLDLCQDLSLFNWDPQTFLFSTSYLTITINNIDLNNSSNPWCETTGIVTSITFPKVDKNMFMLTSTFHRIFELPISFRLFCLSNYVQYSFQIWLNHSVVRVGEMTTSKFL